MHIVSNEYLAPDIRVIEIKAQGVLCVSGVFSSDSDSTDGYSESGWDWD